MKLIPAFLLTLIVYGVKAQNPLSATTKVHFSKPVIENNEDFVFSIAVLNSTNYSLFISPNPVVSSIVGGFGDLQIRVERLDSSCFKVLDIDEDPWGIKFDDYVREIKPGDSVLHKIDIRNYGFMKKGVYRVRIYYSYIFSGKKKSTESNWEYIEVKKYIPLKTPNLFREEKIQW